MAYSECRIRRRINFYEVDSAGIVHFSWYYRYMEEAEHALWRSVGLSLAPTREFGYPRVAAAFEFRRPLRFDDEIDLTMKVEAIGRTSLTYRCTITRGDDAIATGTMTTVCIAREPGTASPVPVPQFVREALAT